MTNGLGAGFALLTMLGILVGLAVLLGITTLGVLAFRRRTGRVPAALRYLAVAALAVVLAVSGFGVLAFYDEVLLGSALLLALVFVPLAAVVVRLRRTTDPRRLDLVATTALAWSLPFVVGIVMFFGGTVSFGTALGLAPSAPGRLVLSWVAVGVAGVAAVVGASLLGTRIAGLLSPATPA